MSSALDTVNAYFSNLAEGRVPEALALFADDVIWHQPGANKFSGTHTGPDAVASILGQMVEDTSGTFIVAPTGPAMVNEDHVTVPLSFSGTKGNESLNQPGIDLFIVRDGRIAEVYLFSSDPDAEDRFWGN